MINRKYLLISLTVFLFLLTEGQTVPTARIEGGVPSDLIFKKPTRRIQDVRFVLTAQEDLRLMFCEPADLSDRIRRSVCVFDVVGLPLGKNNSDLSTREITLQKISSVEEVLRKAGMGKWRGGQPQMRIISKNSICQSPLFDSQSSYPNASDFLKIRVSPGDFVILATVD